MLHLRRLDADAGLPQESRMLFDLARDASGPDRNRIQFRLYAAGARLLGWPLMGRISCLMDHLR